MFANLVLAAVGVAIVASAWLAGRIVRGRDRQRERRASASPEGGVRRNAIRSRPWRCGIFLFSMPSARRRMP